MSSKSLIPLMISRIEFSFDSWRRSAIAQMRPIKRRRPTESLECFSDRINAFNIGAMPSDQVCWGIRSLLPITSSDQYLSRRLSQSLPVETITALIAPIDVPLTHLMSGRMPFSYRNLKAPTWKSPSVPPPPSTIPVGIISPLYPVSSVLDLRFKSSPHVFLKLRCLTEIQSWFHRPARGCSLPSFI